MESPVIALMTDFGEDDFFVASLKGVILKISPSARIMDITHRIPSFNLEAASFVLSVSFRYFPSQTIFLVVVDPGVGSARKVILAKTKDYYFIAPDNGVLTLALEEEKVDKLREVTQDKYFLPGQSRTFEGRDRMAPVAAWLSRGIPCEEFGPELASYEKLCVEKPQIKGNEVIGSVLYEDKFGNLITNIPSEWLSRLQEKTGKARFVLSVKGHKISSLAQSYSSVEKGELLFLAGSVGTVEIAAGQESAAEKLKAKIGDEVRIGVKDR